MSDQAQANICESHHFVWTWPINDPGHGSIGVCDLCGAVKVDECRPARPAMTGDDLAEKVAAVLHHEGWPADDGWTLTPDTCETCARSLRQAAALLPLIREREAAAWERALREAASGYLHTYPEIYDDLRDRAAANPYAGSEGGE